MRVVQSSKALLHRDDHAFHRWNASGEWFEQWQRVGVGDDQTILGVADDVFDVGRREADVQRVEHGTHPRSGVIGLEMARAVPHEGGHPVTGPDADIVERMRQLMRPVPRLGKRLPPGSRGRGGDDLLPGCHRCAAVEYPRHRERRVLHAHW